MRRRVRLGVSPRRVVGGTPTPTPGLSANAQMLAALATLNRPVNLALVGSSKTRYHAITVNNEDRTLPTGPLSISQRRTRRYRLLHFPDTVNQNYGNMSGHIFAGDGQQFSKMFQRVPAILASQADLAVVQMTANSFQINDFDIYGNDLGTPITDVGFNALLQQVLDSLITGMNGLYPGIPVIVEQLIPRRSDAASLPPQFAANSAARPKIPGINSYATAQCEAKGIPVIKNYAVVVPAGDPNGDPRVEYLSTDRIHRSFLGAWVEAPVWNAVIEPYCPVIADPDPLAAGNLCTNPQMSGTGGLADGYVANRRGTAGAQPVYSIVTDGNGKRWQEVAFDTSTIPDGVQENVDFVVPVSASPSTGYGRARFRYQVDAGPSWYGQPQGIAVSGSNVAKSSINVSPANAGLTDPTDTAADRFLVDTADFGIEETQPFAFSTTASTLTIRGPSVRRGTGIVKFRFTDVEMRPTADPRPLMYKAAQPVGATMVGGATASYTFVGDGVTKRQIQFACTKPARYALSGADAALWTIDDRGLATRKTPMNYGSPDDADGNNVDQFTVTATPFDTREPADTIKQDVTVTASYAYTGFTDIGNSPAGDITTNSNWTPMPGYVAGTIVYTGPSANAVRLAGTTGAGVYAPQQGDTIKQQVSFEQRFSTASSGVYAILAKDNGDWLGINQISGAGYRIISFVGGVATVLGTFAVDPNQGFTQGDVPMIRIAEPTPGQFVLEMGQNGVKLGVASVGVAPFPDITSLVTGSGAFASARKSSYIPRTSTQTASWRRWNNIIAPASYPWKQSLPSVTFKASGTQTLTLSLAAIGNGPGSIDIVRTPGSAIDIGALTGPAGAPPIVQDGDALRYDGGLVMGTYTVREDEAKPDYVRSPRQTLLTLNVIA